MKNFSDLTSEKQSVLFKKHGAFFAFSNDQFLKAGGDPTKKYVDFGNGLYAPKESENEISKGIIRIHDEALKEYKELYTVEQIVLYEASNHEICITYDASDTIEACKFLGIDKETVLRVLRENPSVYNEY